MLSFLFSHIHYHMSWTIFPPLLSPLFSCVSCVVFVRVQMHVCICVCMCLCVCMLCMLTWCSRGGGPSQAQTNSPLSLKAMNSPIQTESRLSTQVKKTGRVREKRNTFVVNSTVMDNQTLREARSTKKLYIHLHFSLDKCSYLIQSLSAFLALFFNRGLKNI